MDKPEIASIFDLIIKTDNWEEKSKLIRTNEDALSELINDIFNYNCKRCNKEQVDSKEELCLECQRNQRNSKYKTNFSYNTKECIDVKYGTWININDHLPELYCIQDEFERQYNNEEEETDNFTIYRDLLSFWDDEFDEFEEMLFFTEDCKKAHIKAVNYLKKIIENVKDVVSFEDALRYYEKHDLRGWSDEVIVYCEKDGVETTRIMQLFQFDHYTFQFEVLHERFLRIEKRNENIYFEEEEDGVILNCHWTPLPSDEIFNDCLISKPTEDTFLILKNHSSGDYCIGYYYYGKYYDYYEKKAVEDYTHWFYLPNYKNK